MPMHPWQEWALKEAERQKNPPPPPDPEALILEAIQRQKMIDYYTPILNGTSTSKKPKPRQNLSRAETVRKPSTAQSTGQSQPLSGVSVSPQSKFNPSKVVKRTPKSKALPTGLMLPCPLFPYPPLARPQHSNSQENQSQLLVYPPILNSSQTIAPSSKHSTTPVATLPGAPSCSPAQDTIPTVPNHVDAFAGRTFTQTPIPSPAFSNSGPNSAPFIPTGQLFDDIHLKQGIEQTPGVTSLTGPETFSFQDLLDTNDDDFGFPGQPGLEFDGLPPLHVDGEDWSEDFVSDSLLEQPIDNVNPPQDIPFNPGDFEFGEFDLGGFNGQFNFDLNDSTDFNIHDPLPALPNGGEFAIGPIDPMLSNDTAEQVGEIDLNVAQSTSLSAEDELLARLNDDSNDDLFGDFDIRDLSEIPVFEVEDAADSS